CVVKAASTKPISTSPLPLPKLKTCFSVRAPRWAWLGAVAFVALKGCGGQPSNNPDAGPSLWDAAPDGAFDAFSTPFSIAIDDGEGGSPPSASLEVSSNPLRIQLRRANGELLLQSQASGLLVGVSQRGGSFYHEVTAPSPPFIEWHALDWGVASENPHQALISDGMGRSARLSLSRIDRGVLRLRIEVISGMEAAALLRLRWVIDDGSYQGLGERFTGADARGWIVPMQLSVTTLTRESGLNEHHVPVPFLVNSRSYGLFVESREAGAFDVGATNPNEVWVTFEGTRLDLLFFAQPTPREVIAAYTRYTGLPILPPRWAFAPMHWRNEWRNREALENEVRDLLRLHIPATCFWIDNPWMSSYNDNVFDERRFPEPHTMLQMLRNSGFRPLLWNVPYLDRPEDGTPRNRAEMLYIEAERNGHLVRTRSGNVFLAPSALSISGFRSAAALVDLTTEGGRAFWQRTIDPLVRDLGVRAFKLDYGEDVVPEFAGTRLHLRFGDGTTERETHNVFAMHYHTPYRRALDTHSDEGGFILARASCYGGQRIADIIWPGDIDSDFSRGDARNVGGLPAAISAMISLAASGFPSFASDTGGFREGPPTLETLLRWAEHTAFSPFLQLGGGGEHHNPWLYEPTPRVPDPTSTYRELARMHTSLIPYFRIHAIRASQDGTPPILHPAMAFPEDRGGYGDPDAYLLGEDLFVAPVVTSGATRRVVHLPPGKWVHLWSRQSFDGARDIEIDAPIGRPPVFVRWGAIIPMLAHDLETLVPAPSPLDGYERIDPSDRPFMRALVFPGERRRIESEEGLAIEVVDPGPPLHMVVEPVSRKPDLGIRAIRLEIDRRPIGAPPPSTVRFDGVAPARSTRTAVESGCGPCWAEEDGVIWVGLRAERRTSIVVE
ncbi:MAG: hypothetical protein NZM37_09510, partial [Sandaracinaceae bacterium]|nr:hypothetical protein [Sandaracinaceae bacterium]